jgi:HSP20 family molecular chaperone IbpA
VNWPNIELSETDKEVWITAKLPSLDEKDIDVALANGCSPSGERKERKPRTGIGASASDSMAGSNAASVSMKSTRTK